MTFLVYGDPAVLDVADAYGLPQDIAAKLHYTGAVCPASSRVTTVPGPRAAELRVLVCAGGGEDGYDLLRGMVAVARGPLRNASLSMTVVAGPLLPAAQRQALAAARQGDPRIELLDAVPSMAPLIETADVVVGMGGYNTVYEVLRAETPLLVMPRTEPRQEQLERARRLAGLGLLSLVSRDQAADPDAFAAAVTAAAATRAPAAHRCPVPLDGARRAAAFFMSGEGLSQTPGCVSQVTG